MSTRLTGFSWRPKNWCFWTAVLEKTLESPLDRKDFQPVHPKGDQSWVFIGRTGVEAETPILQPPDVKSWLIWKDPDDGKEQRREEKGTTGWDGWMASPSQWTWVSVNSGSWWWTGRPGVLQSTGLQRVRQRLNNWTELNDLAFSYHKFSENGQTSECALGHAVLRHHYFFQVLGPWAFANLSGSHNTTSQQASLISPTICGAHIVSHSPIHQSVDYPSFFSFSRAK